MTGTAFLARVDMPRVSDNLRDAQALAEFSNLEPQGVEYFRNNYPEFVPQGWWDYQSGQSVSKPLSGINQYGKKVMGADKTGEKQWQLTQSILQHSWKHQFKDEDGVYSLVALITSVFDPNYLLAEELRSQKLPEGYTAQSTPESYTITNAESNIRIILPPRPAFENLYGRNVGSTPFHRAVVYLFQNSWRARFCAECNKRFVAAEPKNKFCSETCSNKNRLRQKREWFRKNGKQWRRKVKRAKAKAARSAARKR
jgi:hypothetical protein